MICEKAAFKSTSFMNCIRLELLRLAGIMSEKLLYTPEVLFDLSQTVINRSDRARSEKISFRLSDRRLLHDSSDFRLKHLVQKLVVDESITVVDSQVDFAGEIF